MGNIAIWLIYGGKVETVNEFLFTTCSFLMASSIVFPFCQWEKKEKKNLYELIMVFIVQMLDS